MAKGDKKEGGGKGNLLRLVVEGGAEALTHEAVRGLIARFTGGAAPAAAPASGASAAPKFDLQGAAIELLGPGRRAQLNAHAAGRVAELNRVAAAHHAIEEEE